MSKNRYNSHRNLSQKTRLKDQKLRGYYRYSKALE